MTTSLSDLTAEQALLGAMMLTADALDRGLETLEPGDFFHPKHQAVFAAIASLEQQGSAVDAVTVSSRLNETGTSVSFGELTGFTVGTPAATAIDAYAKTVEERSLARKLTTGTAETLTALREGAVDAPTACNELAEMAYNFELGEASQQCLSIADISAHHLDALFEELLNPDNVIGHRTGFSDLDNLIGGLRPGTLTVVGARPSMGKSVLGLALAHHQAATCDNPVLLASLEMTHVELYGRLLASQAKVNLRQRPMNEQQLAKLSNADAALQHVPLNIDATSSLSLAELRAKAKRVKRRNNGELSMIIVDYIQLMDTPRGETRQTEVAELSRGLKALAGDLDCAVVALAQLSRSLESRHDKRPLLSDLRESGAIEQDADNVIFIYRDEVYDPQSADKGIAELLVRKARNGPTGTVRLAWLPHLPAFADMHKPAQAAAAQLTM